MLYAKVWKKDVNIRYKMKQDKLMFDQLNAAVMLKKLIVT